MIKYGFDKSGKNKLWLAEQLGVTIWLVSNYLRGDIIPKDKKLDKMLRVLNIEKPIKNLDDLVEN